MESYLFSSQMMHTSQFQKNDPLDWFWDPGSFIQFSKDPKFRHAPEINKHHLTVLTMAVKNDNSAEK